MVEIVEGKSYKTRDGRKVGPMRQVSCGGWLADSGRVGNGCNYDWYKDGTYEYGGKPSKLDLIKEYKDDKPAYLYYDLSLPIGRGKFSFDGSDGTLDTSFTIQPHDMKIIGGYQIENKGETPIHVSSERQKIEEKDDTQMFKVGDRVKQKSTDDYVYKVLAIDNQGNYSIELTEDKIGGGIGNIFTSVTDLNLELVTPSSPVQSRKTLVPGVYGRVRLNDYPAGTGIASVQWQGSNLFTANELREVIQVLGEVADYLEEVE